MRTCAILFLAGLALAANLSAQEPWSSIVPVECASGPRLGAGPGVQMVWTDTILVPFASALQLRFASASMASDDDAIVVSSVQDGEVQVLDRVRLKQWGDRSAFFNGPSVVVSLHLAAGSRGEVSIGEVLAGPPDGSSLLDDACGSDNRSLSSDARVCRLVTSATTTSAGCTGFLINSRSVILSAGHCANPLPSFLVLAEFNVPVSTATGSIVHPPVADQYPVDQSSIAFHDNGIGDDWCVARLHPNSSGETAFDRQGDFDLANSMPVFVPGFGPTLRVTGNGIDDTPDETRNGTQQTSTGPLIAVIGDLVTHQVDTDNGNSGSPIILTSSGEVIGIHTAGGCASIPFVNNGTSILASALQTAITNASGCQSATLLDGASQSFSCDNVIFDINPDDTRWNAVGVSSTSDWDISIESATSAAGGDTCDFLLANGHLGNVPPVAGRIFQFSGSSNGRGQLAIAESLSIGTPLVSSWSSTRILRLYEFFVATAGSYDVAVAGDASLAWRLYEPGTNASWRTRGSSIFVTGAAVNTSVSGIALTTGWHCIVVARDGGAAAPSPSSLTLSVCPSSGAPVALGPGNAVTISSACRGFTITPTANRWNAVGISSASDWDTTLGPASETQNGGLNSFVIANGHDGAISPTAGTFTRVSGTASGVAQHEVAQPFTQGFTTTGTLAAGDVLALFEFTVGAGGPFHVGVTGGSSDSSFKWRLFAPTGSSAWRTRASFTDGANVGGDIQLNLALSPGVHAIAIFRDAGAASAALPFTVWASPNSSLTTLSPGVTAVLPAGQRTLSLTPSAGRWNAAGVRDGGIGEWNAFVGPAQTLGEPGDVDFVVVNGHQGAISPTTGVFAVQFGAGTAAGEMAPITTAALNTPVTGVLAGANSNQVLEVVEFEVPAAGQHLVTITGSSPLFYDLFAPGDARWRPRGAAGVSGHVGDAPFLFSATPGWHAIVISRDDPNGTIGSLGYTVRVDAPQPLPALTSISPSSATAGAAALTLSCTGTSFSPASEVRWNGAPLPTTFNGATSLSATVAASLVSAAGTASVTVFTPAPGGGTSAARTFTVNNPIPALVSMSPGTALAGSAALTLALNGSGFNGTSIPRWNGTALAVVSHTATQIQATVPAALLSSAGAASITVQNPAPGGGTTLIQSFAVQNPAPVLSAISPASATAGAANLALTLTGSGFNAQSQPRWNGAALAVVSASATQIVATVPAALLASAGTASVTVFAPAPGGGTSATRTFTINNPAPVLASITPATVTAGTAAFTLQLDGSGFNAASQPRWNGSALAVLSVAASQIQATVPAALIASGGTASVTVLNPAPGGGTSAARTITIANATPSLTSLNPASLPAGSGATTILANGSGFSGSSVASWNGSPRTTTLVSATQLSVSVTAADLSVPGFAAVSVSNPPPAGGNSASLSFNVVPPVILALNPPSIPVQVPGAPATVLTVQGFNFVPATARVCANGVMLTPSAASASQLTVSLDPAAIPQMLRRGAVAITVANVESAVSNTVAFVMGSGSNGATIRRTPLAPAPGQPYAALLEGGAPNQLFTLVADLANPAPIVPWPDPATNLVLSVGAAVVPLVDGFGLFTTATGATLDANGRFVLPGFVLPSPPLGISLTVQAVYLDPTAPLGLELSWARFPDQL